MTLLLRRIRWNLELPTGPPLLLAVDTDGAPPDPFDTLSGENRKIDLASMEARLSLMKTIRISEAKRNFTRIFARAKRGETVILQNGDDYMQLVPCAVSDPAPVYPVGSFRHTEEVVAMINAAPTDSRPVRNE